MRPTANKAPMSILRKELLDSLDQLLTPHLIKDYCPNGLQVEGCNEIKKIITGVTASQALINRAIEEKADAILVHHGYFWKGENECITGIKKQRLQSLLTHDINLFAYHLPLDMHSTLGNNAQLADILELEITGCINPNNKKVPGNIGTLKVPMNISDFSMHIANKLQRTPFVENGGNDSKEIKTVAWCTGGAQGYLQLALDQGVDAYITGEASEPAVHLAREAGIHFIAAGHHATERYGAKALGEYLAKEFDLDVMFIDIDNPV
jgi:dinuclear metal center YbgI/SA1388 family protein